MLYVALLGACALLRAFGDTAERPAGLIPRSKAVTPVRIAGEDAKTRTALKSAALPAKWDARDQGWVTSVKNQGDVGTCWAFAANAVIETQLLRLGMGSWDLSEKNMVNLHGWNLTPEVGGNDLTANGYLLRWAGSVAETNDVYAMTMEEWTPSPQLNPPLHIQNVVFTPALDGTQDAREETKQYLLAYGAIWVSTCWSGAYSNGSAYYCNRKASHNHAITLVGWDDDYPASNFKRTPYGDGAWIIKNSWGTDDGDGGYHYVSYYDANFASSGGSIFIPAQESERYDAVRGHDREGAVYDVSNYYSSYYYCQYDLQAAVFTAGWNEKLSAVGVYTSVYPNPYEILVYTNVVRGATVPEEGGVLAWRQTGTLKHAGFTTIPLGESIPLPDGTSYSIIYRQTGSARSTWVNCSVTDWCAPVHTRGDSFFGWMTPSGTAFWSDGVDEASVVDETDVSWGACIKAYLNNTVAAPDGDVPDESEDGSAMLEELAKSNPALLADTGNTFGALAGSVGANGRTLWSSWVAGLDPSNPEAKGLTVLIDASDGTPRLSWSPDRGSARTYTIWGRTALDDTTGWFTVSPEELSTTDAHFFKVSVAVP